MDALLRHHLGHFLFTSTSSGKYNEYHLEKSIEIIERLQDERLAGLRAELNVLIPGGEADPEVLDKIRILMF